MLPAPSVGMHTRREVYRRPVVRLGALDAV